MPRKVDCELVLVTPKGAEVVVVSCLVETEIVRTTATCFVVAGVGTGTASTSAVEAEDDTVASANTGTKTLLVDTVGCGGGKTRVGAVVGTWLRTTAGHAVGTNSSSWGVETTVRVLVLVLVSLVRL
jgi:hypothetical protein